LNAFLGAGAPTGICQHCKGVQDVKVSTVADSGPFVHFLLAQEQESGEISRQTLAARESLITIKRSSSAEPMRHDSVCYCTRFKFCAAIRVICIPSTWRAASRSKAGRSLLLHQRSSSASASPFSILPNDLLIKVQFYEGRSWANEACSFVRRNSP
jgi:hypothetical protein